MWLVVLILVADTQTVAQLQQAGVPVVAAHGHQAALGVDLSAVEGLVRNLHTSEEYSIFSILVRYYSEYYSEVFY